MELANILYEFFGFEALTLSATFTDLLSSVLKIGCGLWLTAFILRSMLLTLSLPDRRF